MKIRHLLAVVMLCASIAPAASRAQNILKVGVTPGSLADSMEVAAREAKRQGLDVRLIEFSDWTTPNTALASGDLDLNYFQHQAFLDNAIKERGYPLQSAGIGILHHVALYSNRVKSFSELKDGARIAVANDPVNQGRGLLLLQKAGLIKLRDGVGAKAALQDIVGNPRKFNFVEIPGPQLVRSLDDVDLAQGYPSHLAAAKLDSANALLFSGVEDDYYAIRFVTRKQNADDPRIRKLIQIYQESPAVREQIKASFNGNEKLYALPWLKP